MRCQTGADKGGRWLVSWRLAWHLFSLRPLHMISHLGLAKAILELVASWLLNNLYCTKGFKREYFKQTRWFI